MVVADLASPELMDQIAIEMKPHLAATDMGPDEFTGHATRRTGALIARSPTVRTLVTHPTILGTLDLSLGDHCSTFQIDLTQLVDIGPRGAGANDPPGPVGVRSLPVSDRFRGGDRYHVGADRLH